MSHKFLTQPSRRVFIKGMAATTVVASSALLPSFLLASAKENELSGTDFSEYR